MSRNNRLFNTVPAYCGNGNTAYVNFINYDGQRKKKYFPGKPGSAVSINA